MQFTRGEQLAGATAAFEQLKDTGKLMSGATRTHSAQNSQVEGLYQEVDKLTKGKGLLPTSEMLVDLVNSSITDAKGLCYRDTYLDRLKAFVPAGNNPNYPDVLVALRVLQQTLDRFDSMLKRETDSYATVATELQTILAALHVAEQDEADWDARNDQDDEDDTKEIEASEGAAELGGRDEEEEDAEYADDESEDDSGEEEEYEEYVTKEQVKRKLGNGIVSDEWFIRERGGDYLFDFDKLDSSELPQYEPPTEGITFVRSEK